MISVVASGGRVGAPDPARRCARRRTLLLAAAAAATCLLSAGLDLGAQALTPSAGLGTGTALGAVLHVLVCGLLALSALAVRHALLVAGRPAWATPAAVLAVAVPPTAAAATAVTAAASGPAPADLLPVAGLPGWSAVTVLAVGAWLRPSRPGREDRRGTAGRLATVLLAWAALAAADAAAPLPGSPAGVLDADTTLALALVLTAAAVAAAELPVTRRWRLALVPAVPVTVLQGLPDLLAAAATGSWLPLEPWAGEPWRAGLPLAMSLAGLCGGVVVAALPARPRPSFSRRAVTFS